jgi:hypothetical protein
LTVKEHFAKGIKEVGKTYVGDLRAMPQEVLGQSPGGAARTPFDYSYEIALINKRISHRLRGEDPGPWQFAEQKWVTCPPDLADKDKMIKFVEDSFAELDTAWAAFDESELLTPIKLPQGETNAYDLASMAFAHAVYHDGQLNYAQSISGDDEMHWDF